MISRRATFRTAAAIFISSITILVSILIAQSIPRKILLTEDERDWLKKNNGAITVGGDPDYPPLDFVNQHGLHDGISEDILRLIETRLGFGFRRTDPETWSGALEGARAGTIDMLTAVSESEERKEYLDLTASYIEMPTVFAVLATNRDIDEVSDLRGKRVCITKNYSSFSYFETNNPGFIIVPVDNDCAGLMEVATGAADAALSDIPVISHAVAENYISNLRILGESGYVHRLSFGIRKGRGQLLNVMNKALASISPRDRQRIIDRWISVEYRNVFYESVTWITITAIIAGAAALVLFVGLWDKTLRALVRSRTRELMEYKTHLEELVAERTHELEETNAALEKANRALDVLARTDTLTGCANRRAFLEAGAREHARFMRHDTPYALIEFDLDHFKLVNDRNGHAAGDRVLMRTVEVVEERLRETDFLARVGGEEFFVLLCDTESDEAAETAERLRHALEEFGSVPCGDKTIRFTASFGVTAAQPGDTDIGAVMSRADQALYRAKETGRNRVETA